MNVFSLVILSIVGFADTGHLSIERRAHRQELNGYIVDYQIRNMTTKGMVITPSDIEFKTDGWVSNSSLASHGIPRRSSVVVKPDETMPGISKVIKNSDGKLSCNEKVSIGIWSDDAVDDCKMLDSASTISLAPGGSGLIRVLYQHAHGAFGTYEMLFGDRSVTLRVGQDVLQDVVPIRPVEKVYPPHTSYVVLNSFKDDECRVSAPDSLHLRLHEPDYAYFSFPEQTVRFSSRMRLSFRYFTAIGSQGETRVRLSQYWSSPGSSGYLAKGSFDEVLPMVDRWTTVEKIVKVEPNAGSLRLDFRISNPDDYQRGEVWIDDISFEAVDHGYLAGDKTP